MNLLSIETSTRKLSLAVSKDGRVIKYRNTMLKRPLSSSIMPGIKKILNDVNMPLKDLDGFAVGLGPGSFTSLRVGLSTVKGLAFASQKPVVGIPSLDLLAMNVPQSKAQVCAVCDARRNMVYACVYDKDGSSLKKKSEYLLAGIDDVLKHVKGETVFVGDGIDLYKDEIKKAKGLKPAFADAKYYFPQARALALLASPRFGQKKYDNIKSLVPLYLYSDHCQIKKR